MRVAVIGGGVFGATAAIHAARAGHAVHLFERQDGLLRSASGLNQFRLHRGYHYPRSLATARECQEGVAVFREEYDTAVIDGSTHYALARYGSKLSPVEYLDALDKAGLRYQIRPTRGLVDGDAVELVVRVQEERYDPQTLRGLVWAKLWKTGVQLHLGVDASRLTGLRMDFDRVVLACYADNNAVAWQLGCRMDEYQFEVCEKPVVRMPDWFGKDTSIVVMDGEFCSIDPYGDTGLHVLGHVKHAIHASNVGTWPEIPEHLRGLVNSGVVRLEDGETRWPAFSDAGGEFVPALYDAEYVGSMLTVRAVLAGKDSTDERPTLVEKLDDRVVRIFSGKVPTAVLAARRTASILKGEPIARAA